MPNVREQGTDHGRRPEARLAGLGEWTTILLAVSALNSENPDDLVDGEISEFPDDKPPRIPMPPGVKMKDVRSLLASVRKRGDGR